MNKTLIIFSLFLILCLAQNDKVQIQIYSESLCPDCIEFYTNSFKKAVQTENFHEICDFNIFAYGNASFIQTSTQYEYTCQHGPNECYGNLIETCTEHYHNQQTVGDFVVCLSQRTLRELYKPNFNDIGPYCADKVGIDWDQIYDCANGQEGNVLEHQVAVATDSLNPTKNYVPWITVDGVHNVEQENQILDNMLQFVCENYKGDQKIEGCQQYNQNIEKQQQQNLRKIIE